MLIASGSSCSLPRLSPRWQSGFISREALVKAAIIHRVVLCASCVIAVCGLGSRSNAQAPTPGAKPPAASSKPAPKAEASAADDLSLRQDRLASRYAELEKLLLKMAEFEGANNPRRSALLKQAATQSSENLTKAKLVQIAKLLNGQQLKRAIDSQTDVQSDIKLLLTLLQSENENANRKSEQDKIKEFIKEFKRMERMQAGLRARTEQSEDPKSFSKEQSGLADQADKLKQEIAEHEGTPAEEQAPSDNSKEGTEEKPGEDSDKPKPEASDKNPDQKDPKSETPEAKQKGAEPSKGEERSTPKQGDEKTPPSQSPPSEGEQKSDPSKEDKPGQGGKEAPMPSEEGAQETPPEEKQEGEQQKSPVQRRMEAAQKRMQEAKKRLDEAKREEAVKEQQKAEEELKKAVAELEEILKQLREEEIEQTLADLATRFRKMLEMQLKVNESTLQLTKIPADKRGREVDLQSTRLSADEQKIMHEAEKALTLLGDEGSSTAFPATVEQLVQDMQQIVERLATVKIDSITIGIQEETVETLEQLIAALEQEQKEREKKKQEEQESPAPEQQPGEDPLIDRIAELKMIKSLQVKINQRTQRFSKLLTDPNDPVGQANSADLESAILQLSKREADVFRVTRDIVVGRKK